MAPRHCPDYRRVFVKRDPDKRQRLRSLLHEIVRLSQDDHIAVIPQTLHEFVRYRADYAAVQQLAPVYLDYPRHDRHRSGRAHPREVLITPVSALVEDRLSGLDVRRPDVEVHRIVCERLVVERVQHLRQFVVAELLSVEVACLYERPEAAVARIPAVFLVVSQRPAYLARLEITPQNSSGGYPGGAVKLYSVLQEDIQHPAGKQSPHGAAFHN